MLGIVGGIQAQQWETTNSVKQSQWGIKASLNISSLNFNASDSGKSNNTKSVAGGTVGLTYSHRFGQNWRLNSGLEMSLKGFSADETNGSRTLTARAAYVQIPVTCGYIFGFGNWNFDPRAGLFFAYGVAGNYGLSDGGESKQTFGNKLLKPFDMGLTFGIYADNGKFVFGIGHEIGLTEANGERFTVSGGTLNTQNLSITVGYLF